MASLDRLPADQRAVLELVLRRGRTYDQIATLLSLDRAGVRQRALAAFDALGPETEIPGERRGLIADYLLGQLPPRVAETVRDRLGSSPAERAWARILASELAPIARDSLPEIPVESSAAAAAGRDGDPERGPEPAGAGQPAASAADPGSGGRLRHAVSPGRRRRSSRLGGAVVLGLGAAVVLGLIAVLIFVVLGGSDSKHGNSQTTAVRRSSTSTTSTQARVITAVNLLPPSGGGQAKGIAQVVDVGSNTGVVIYAQAIPANKNNFYAVWLYNSATDYKLVGYVSPGVGSNGQLQTTGPLPANANHYGQLLVAVQTKDHPKPPGPVVLQGKLTLK